MSWRGFLGWLALSLAVFSGACAPPQAVKFPKESISVPDELEHYSSEARPDGAVGGPGVERIQASVAAALKKHGDHAEADGSLSATASWMLREVHNGRTIDTVGCDAASRHFGFGGVVGGYIVFDALAEPDWNEQLEHFPRGIPITRYGIRLSPSGRSGVVIFGSMEASYEPIPRAFDPGQSVQLKGETAQRFKSCELFWTKPDGSVEKRECHGRAFDEKFELVAAGAYRLEVMGDAGSGPTIVAVVPLYVGVPEPLASGVTSTTVDPDEAEARMFTLLNEVRRAAGVEPLQADGELREIALGHSKDMVDHHFVAHVSPTTGSPEDRARRSGIVVSMFGENIAASTSPEVAHEGLMNSPGHRANMLEPRFTHVGIAARKADTGLVVTMNFGRRPPPSALPAGTTQVEAAILALRASKGLSAPTIDAVYRVSAQAGAEAYATGKSIADVDKAVERALQKETERLNVGRLGGCTTMIELLELKQLNEVVILTQPSLKSFGVGTRLRKDSKGTRLSTVILMQGAPCN
ncbi:MAG TPA: CAP domain-containing protein [Polyangiaceae bacterium]|nr:CAP domain-containing protein [Polyangiaceae bacterium]